MTPISNLLAEAATAGIVMHWKPDGKLHIAGGTFEQRKAIGTRKHELAACPRCEAVIEMGSVHCVPPASPEVLSEARRAAADPFFGTLNWVPPVQPCDRCQQDAPYRFPLPSWCEECMRLPQRRCESCGHSQPGTPGSVELCAYDGCGNRLRWIDHCVLCGQDARPGSVTCVKCSAA